MIRGVRTVCLMAVLAAALAAGCRDTASPPTARAVAQLSVTPSVDSLSPGEIVQLAAQADDSTGGAVAGVTVLWSSSSRDVATVDSTGQVHALTPGLAVVAAVANGVRAEASIVVRRVAASLQILPESLGLAETARLRVVLRDASGVVLPGSAPLTSADTAILASGVSTPDGLTVVTARRMGTVGVSAVVGGRTLTGTVVVGAPHIQHVVFPHRAMTIPVGVDRPLDVGVFVRGAGVDPGALSNGRIDWPVTFQSGNPAVASVDPQGVLRGVAPGTTTITATSGGLTASVQVTTVALAEQPIFATIATGGLQTCGLSTGGIAYCWGMDDSDRLGLAVPAEQVIAGTGIIEAATLPLPVKSPVRFARLGASTSAEGGCALAEAGDAWCWWSAAGARLVPGGLHFTSLANSDRNACALTADGRAYCWTIVFGVDPSTGGTTPVLVSSTLRFTAVVAGGCGLAVDGTLYCWNVDQPMPQPTGAGRTYKALFPGGAICAIAVDDVTYCGGSVSSWLPAPDRRVGGSHVFVDVSAASEDLGPSNGGCGLDAAGAVWCWGYVGTRYIAPDAPERRTDLPPASQIRIGSSSAGHACVLTRSRVVYCWGNRNEVGVMGVAKVDLGVEVPPDFATLDFSADHRTAAKVLGQP